MPAHACQSIHACMHAHALLLAHKDFSFLRPPFLLLSPPRASPLLPPLLQSEVVKYEHIRLAILDSNPLLSSASRSALQTAAGLATQNASKLTVMFVDEAGQKVGSQRLQMVQG